MAAGVSDIIINVLAQHYSNCANTCLFVPTLGRVSALARFHGGTGESYHSSFRIDFIFVIHVLVNAAYTFPTLYIPASLSGPTFYPVAAFTSFHFGSDGA